MNDGLCGSVSFSLTETNLFLLLTALPVLPESNQKLHCHNSNLTRFICQNLDHRNMPPPVYISEKNKGSEQCILLCISCSSCKFPTGSIMITFMGMAG